MTTPNEPTRPDGAGRPETDVDKLFAGLVSSMPDLASMNPPMRVGSLEDVEVEIPVPGSTGESLRLILEVPDEVAPVVRAEFSPDRIAAMMQAITSLATLSVPPQL